MLRRSLLFFIKTYQVTISPMLGPVCRFHPTCSHYAIEALEKKTLPMGVFLIVVRVLKCNPLFKGGQDPVI
ncbi:MAG: membrane protein insertion efficiency factor YidD [Candidatus Marinimicrobia bacterium]|nr:membrane protein insertion efficiency factor YidD [Candidatus Neomarinimicrobiota bacterium]